MMNACVRPSRANERETTPPRVPARARSVRFVRSVDSRPSRERVDSSRFVSIASDFNCRSIDPRDERSHRRTRAIEADDARANERGDARVNERDAKDDARVDAKR
jgi:hypothetical protein